jgi:hypothetical protein
MRTTGLGESEGLLLMHGNPFTHVCRHKVTPRLAEEFGSPGSTSLPDTVTYKTRLARGISAKIVWSNDIPLGTAARKFGVHR